MEGNETVEVNLLFPLGKAWYEQDGQIYLISLEDSEPKLCRTGDIELLLDVTPEHPETKQLRKADIRKELLKRYQAHTALSFALDGLDSSLTESTRKAVIKRANKLCEDSGIYTFVSTRLSDLWDSLLGEGTDVQKAMEIAEKENFTALKQIYSELGQIHSETVFVDFPLGDEQDRDKAQEIIVELESKGIKPSQLSPQEKSLTDVVNKLRDYLLLCNIVVLCCDQVDSYWFDERLRYYQTIQVYRKIDKLPPMRILIYGSKKPKSELPKYTTWKKYPAR